MIQNKDEPNDADLVQAQSAESYLALAFDLDEKSGALGELKATKKFLEKFADRLPKPENNTEQNAGDQSPT